MNRISCLNINASLMKSLRSCSLLAVGLIVWYLGFERPQIAEAQCPTGVSLSGNEAFNSTIPLQMPFIAGETWTVGGGGSFYGNNAHCNANEDHYATDWNKANDYGAVVLPVADGTVSYVVNPPCPAVGYGCRVEIDHKSGFRTRYAHLSSVNTVVGNKLYTWNMIGKVGNSGTPGMDPHLHLSFLHYDNNGYLSRCWNNGNGCQQQETAMSPQGYRPSPMYTASGPVTLQDWGSYTSVNNRVQLPDLRSTNGWTTDIYIRNDSTEYRTILVHFYNAGGGYTGYSSCGLGSNQMCILFGVSAGTQAYVDGSEAASVAAVRYRGNPLAYALHVGVSMPDYQVLLPLVHKYNWGTSSKVIVKNASATPDTATIRFQTSSGEVCPLSYSLNGNAAVTVDLRTVGCLSNGIYGVRISSSGGQPLAVVTTQEADVNSDGNPESVSDYEGFANGAYSIVSTNSFYPLLMRDNYGGNAGIMLQNPNATSNNLQINYFNQSPGGYCCTSYHAVGAYGVTAVYPLPNVPTGFVGGGIALSNSGLTFNSIVNQVQSGGNQSMSYAATSIATTKATVPVIFQSYGGWSTGISIQNTGSNADTARVTYFGFNGSALNTVDYFISPGSTRAIYPLPVANGTIGSVVVTTLGGQPISVVANQVQANMGTADVWMASTAINR